MSSYLVQSILIPEKFILRKALYILLLIEFLWFFGLKIHAPASWMVPMGFFNFIYIIFTQKLYFWISFWCELCAIAAIESSSKHPNFEVCLPHLEFLLFNIEIIHTFLLVLRILYLWIRNLFGLNSFGFNIYASEFFCDKRLRIRK